jgi:intergrase/recombinase
MDDYGKYEEDCKEIRESNARLLKEFGSWLILSGLSEKTIKNHISNIDFYINEYLLYEEAIEVVNGINKVSMFLGYWFIKKVMWASKASIKSNAASLKKFYTFVNEKGLIDKEDLNDLMKMIKEEMPEWLEELDHYDNSSIEDAW